MMKHSDIDRGTALGNADELLNLSQVPHDQHYNAQPLLDSHFKQIKMCKATHMDKRLLKN